MPAELATSLTTTEAQRLEQAEAIVRNFCGWHIAPSRTETVTVRGTGRGLLLLPSLHVTAITSITDGDTLLTNEDDYTWTPPGVVTRAGLWSTDVVTVEYVHGYATVPPEVAGIVQAVAQRAIDNPGSKPREQSGPFADTYSQTGFNQAPALGLLDGEKETLRRYRLPCVG